MAISHVRTLMTNMACSGKLIDKDVVLAAKIEEGINVAQFVSFFPGKRDEQIRFIRTQTHSLTYPKMAIREAIDLLMKTAIDKTLNIRTFTQTQHQGNPFIYGIKSVDEVVAKVEELTEAGYYVIAHETIDVNDGGMSGVASHGYVECAPGYTPRLVENCPEDAAVFTEDDFAHIVNVIYGDKMEAAWDKVVASTNAEFNRVEFSIHPRRLGVFHEQYLIWEVSSEECDKDITNTLFSRTKRWPNALSRLIGDKVYGLMMANILISNNRACQEYDIISVPKTTVFMKNKAVGIFQFGASTGSGEVWTRTCPSIPIPGKHPTYRGYIHPYALLEDGIESCIIQDQVNASFSGSAIVDAENKLMCEYVEGFGDTFMTGTNPEFRKMTIPPSFLEQEIDQRIIGSSSSVPIDFLLPEIWKIMNQMLQYSTDDIAKFRMEWAYDGYCFWILQLHADEVLSSGNVIVPGEPENGWVDFEVGKSLEDLRELVTLASEEKKGICIKARIGITSHIADVCRKAKIPSILG